MVYLMLKKTTDFKTLRCATMDKRTDIGKTTGIVVSHSKKRNYMLFPAGEWKLPEG